MARALTDNNDDLPRARKPLNLRGKLLTRGVKQITPNSPLLSLPQHGLARSITLLTYLVWSGIL